MIEADAELRWPVCSVRLPAVTPEADDSGKAWRRNGPRHADLAGRRGRKVQKRGRGDGGDVATSLVVFITSSVLKTSDEDG